VTSDDAEVTCCGRLFQVRVAATTGNGWCRVCCAGCERETDVVIMIDSSANIGLSKFMTLRSVALSVINLLSVETGVVRVAVVTYAQHADVNVYLGR